MTDRPIIFSAPMVRALLDGRKTQTRRVLNPQPVHPIDSIFSDGTDWWTGSSRTGDRDETLRIRFAIGDRLWVREQHYLTDDGEAEAVIYTADDAAVAQHHSDITRLQAQYGLSDEWARPHLRIRPSIHMPRWASRLTEIITDVRVQQLQEISEADAAAEGCEYDSDGWYDYQMPAIQRCATARDSYRTLWNSLYGPEAWDANPWVSAISFRTILANIDSAEAAA